MDQASQGSCGISFAGGLQGEAGQMPVSGGLGTAHPASHVPSNAMHLASRNYVLGSLLLIVIKELLLEQARPSLGWEAISIKDFKLPALQIEGNCSKCLLNGRDISARLCFLQLHPMIDRTILLHRNPSMFPEQFLLR